MLRGNAVKSVLDIEESFRMVMEKAIEEALSGNNVSLEELLVNTPTKLMFQVPAGKLEAGKRYTVKIATYLGSNRSEPLRTQRLIPCGKSLECK